MSKDSKNSKKSRLNRRGIILIVALAVVIFAVNIITLSYSWFVPKSVDGSGLKFEDKTNLRSENCTIETFTGTVQTEADLEHGIYKNQVVYGNDAQSGNVTVPAGGIVYFRTNITNQSEKYSSVVSLYIESMPAGVTVACTSPSNTVRATSSAESDYYIMRNAYVKLKDEKDADGPGLLAVEWFVQNSSGSDVTVNLNEIYLMYN